jgi:hypothetical protein
MKLMIRILTNPPTVHVIEQMMPMIEQMASGLDQGKHKMKGIGFSNREEAREWLENLLGSRGFDNINFEEDDEEDDISED